MKRRGTPEADLQRAVVQALRITLPRGAIIHHCANEVTEAGPRGAKRQAILVGMGVHAGFADRFPHELSGGMRQRAELGRALVADTDLLLLDEPFSALDYQTRIRMRRELASALAPRDCAVVLVTHDIEEAVQLADRIVVLGPRPTAVRRVLHLAPGRPRLPTAPGVAAATQAILEELGLT